MGDGNGAACCILGVCCPPASATRKAAIVKAMSTDLNMAEAAVYPIADWFMEHVTPDLMAKAIAKHGKGA
jgi:hypothetical protein